MLEVIVTGSGLFPAICSLHLARLLGPRHVALVTSDRHFGGDCPELLLARLLDPRALEIVEDYMVMEWDRVVLVDGQGPREIAGRAVLLDPVQVHADRLEAGEGMTVITGVQTLLPRDGMVIADGAILAAGAVAAMPRALSGSRQVALAAAGIAAGLDCPMLADFTASPARQIVPIGGGRILINTLAGKPRRDASGGIDLAATFPVHAAINGLLGEGAG